MARSVGVHTAAIMETLRKVYDAGGVADELENPATAAASGGAETKATAAK